jgi:hypothetical protein
MSNELKRWKRSQLEYMHPEHEVVDAKSYDALLAERDALAIRIYNSGYMAGHHDTVEGQFTDIHRSDMATYHAEEVSELIAALQGSQP